MCHDDMRTVVDTTTSIVVVLFSFEALTPRGERRKKSRPQNSFRIIILWDSTQDSVLSILNSNKIFFKFIASSMQSFNKTVDPQQ